MLITGIAVLRLKVPATIWPTLCVFAVHTGSGGQNAQVDVMTLRGDGNVAIGLDTASEKLEVDGTVKCTELKFEDVDGVTTNLSSVISDLLLRVAELEDRYRIDITTGVNGTFIFRIANNVYSESQIDGDVIHPTETYTHARVG